MKDIAKFSMSGTLGDVFIVYCKLYDFWGKTGKNIKLYRYSCHMNFDKPIIEFFKNIPFIKYIAPCRYVENEAVNNFKKLDITYLNTAWHGRSVSENEPDDPRDIKMKPFPEVFIKPKKLPENKFNIGIQLHSGRPDGNFKGFSLCWIAALRRWLPSKKFNIYLFGTGAKYNLKKLEKFCQKHSIKNFVGKTDFVEWMQYMKAMNFFITPEGFSGFFSMSQRVRTLMFIVSAGLLLWVHPEWRKENIIMGSGYEIFTNRVINKICQWIFKRNRLLKPLKPSQVRALIDNEIIFR